MGKRTMTSKEWLLLHEGTKTAERTLREDALAQIDKVFEDYEDYLLENGKADEYDRLTIEPVSTRVGLIDAVVQIHELTIKGNEDLEKTMLKEVRGALYKTSAFSDYDLNRITERLLTEYNMDKENDELDEDELRLRAEKENKDKSNT